MVLDFSPLFISMNPLAPAIAIAATTIVTINMIDVLLVCVVTLPFTMFMSIVSDPPGNSIVSLVVGYPCATSLKLYDPARTFWNVTYPVAFVKSANVAIPVG